jgi:hypothetical protein
LPVEVRQQLLDGIYAGEPFRSLLGDLGLMPNQVWDHQKPTTTGCVCAERREHQRRRMAKNRG